jgi:hypothetical protein
MRKVVVVVVKCDVIRAPSKILACGGSTNKNRRSNICLTLQQLQMMTPHPQMIQSNGIIVVAALGAGGGRRG